MPSAAALFRRLLHQRVRAPEEDASLPKEDMVDLRAILEEDETDDEDEEEVVGADDVAVVSKIAALR